MPYIEPAAVPSWIYSRINSVIHKDLQRIWIYHKAKQEPETLMTVSSAFFGILRLDGGRI